MGTDPLHVYHIWCGDEHHGAAWNTPVEEHFTALEAAKFTGRVYVGLVGSPGNRADVAYYLRERFPMIDGRLIVQRDEGFEMVTLQALKLFVAYADPATPVLYAHNKGAFQSYPGNHSWRRAMTGMLVGSWRDRLDDLAEGYDAVGLHWLTHEEWPEQIKQSGIMGGNFWWATAGYLKRLPPVEFGSRYCAEGWLGLRNPKVKCLKDGWPEYA